MTNIIEKGIAKQMSILLLDNNGVPVIGKSPLCSIRRASDGYYWNGAGFNWSSGAVGNSMTQAPQNNGVYYFNLAALATTSEDILQVIYSENTIPAYDTEEFHIKDIFTDVDEVLLDTARIFDVALGAILPNSFADKIMNKDISQAYSKATDSLEALSDKAVPVADIATAVWDKPLASHVGPTTMGGNQNLIDDIAGTGIVKDTDSITKLAHQLGAKGTDAIHTLANSNNLALGTITPKLPDNFIMGSTDQDPHDTQIDDLVNSSIAAKGLAIYDVGQTLTRFKTNLVTMPDGYPNNMVLVVKYTSFSVARRITNFENVGDWISIEIPLPAAIIGGEEIFIMDYAAPAGSGLTEASIANYVWNEAMAGHTGGGTSGAYQNLVPTISSGVSNVSGRIPGALTTGGNIKASVEEKNATVGLSAQEKPDVQQEAMDALNLYAPPTRIEATADKVEIIAEVNANEVKVDAVKSVVDGIAIQTGAMDLRLPSDPADQSQVEAAISASQAILQGEHATIIAKENALLAAVLSIQNNTTTVIVVPPVMEKPETPGTKTYRIVLMNYDGIGGMEDFYQSSPGVYEAQVKVDEIDGTPILPYAYLVRDSTGVYHIDFLVDYTDPNRPILFTFQLVSLLIVTRYATRTSEITDAGTLLEQIKADTTDILIDTGISLPDQIEAARVDINLNTDQAEVSINANVDNTRTQILNEIQATQDMIDEIGDSVVTKVSIPNNITIPLGVSKLTKNIGLYDNIIQVQNIDIFPETGVIQIEGEKIVYSGKDKTASELTGCIRAWDINGNASINSSHSAGAKVVQLVVSRFMIEYFNEKNELIVPTEIPRIILFNDLDTTISDEEMLKDTSTGSWRRDFAFSLDNDFKNLKYKITTKINGLENFEFGSIKTEYAPGTQSMAEGGGSLFNGEFLFDQNGYIASDGTVHEWPDEYKGYVRDPSTGDRLQDVVVRAFRVLEDGTVARDNHPPFESITDLYGNFEGAIDRGIYEFEFTRDGHVFFSVRREINP